jgi:peptidoglycan/xylan/chitin deacetylase (PgdA/CDA1 family)
MRRQKESVEASAGTPVVSVRQHCLYFDMRLTPQVHAAAGLKADSSVGFNDDVGFRLGTAHPVRLGGAGGRGTAEYVEIPLAVQDKALDRCTLGFHPRLLGPLVDRIVEEVRTVGGVLTLLWHPGHLARPGYLETYEHLLGRLRAEGAWFGTMREVREAWLARADAPSAGDAAAAAE